jgi:hypothetical protein
MKLTLLILSIILYVIACSLPAYKYENNTPLLGIGCLFMGIFAFLYNMWGFVAWLSNIPFLITAILNFYRKPALWLIIWQIIGVISSFSAFFVKKMMLNEGGAESAITFSHGGYLWILSLIMMLVVSFLS